MPAPKTRRHDLYCLVVCSRLVIAKMPDRFVKWTVQRAALLRALKLHLDVKVSDVVSIEGQAGLLPNAGRYYLEQDAKDKPKFDAAFSGDPERFTAFNLFAWNDATGEFDFYRPALTSC